MNLQVWTRIALGLSFLSAMSPRVPGMAQTTTSQAIAALPQSMTVGNKRYDAEKELARLTRRYGLTKEQKAKIEPLLLEQQREVHTLGEDAALSDTEWAGAVRKVHLQTVAKVKLQLTDVQASKYAKDEAKLAKKPVDGQGDDDDGPPPDGPPPGGGPGGPGGGPPA